jgi:hypothetical protein
MVFDQLVFPYSMIRQGPYQASTPASCRVSAPLLPLDPGSRTGERHSSHDSLRARGLLFGRQAATGCRPSLGLYT